MKTQKAKTRAVERTEKPVRVASVPTLAEARKRASGRVSLLDSLAPDRLRKTARFGGPEVHGPADHRKVTGRK